MGKSLKQEIEPGAICVLWAKSPTRRRIVEVLWKVGFNNVETWETRPYLVDGFYHSTRASEHELTLIDNEMELLAWLSATNC